MFYWLKLALLWSLQISMNRLVCMYVCQVCQGFFCNPIEEDLYLQVPLLLGILKWVLNFSSFLLSVSEWSKIFWSESYVVSFSNLRVSIVINYLPFFPSVLFSEPPNSGGALKLIKDAVKVGPLGTLMYYNCAFRFPAVC